MSELPQHPHYASPTGGSNVKIAILFGAVLALLAANIYLFLQLDQTRQDLTKTRDSLQTEIATLREASSVSAQTSKRTMETLRDELETARRQAAMAVGQAKTEAEAKVAQVQKQIESEQKKNQAAQQVLRQEIGEVKSVASETKEKVGEVKSEVGQVKSEVASTKSELEKTIADLKTVRGDLGVQSGLIATNAKELGALKALGERNYFDIKLGKTKAPVKVGDIALLLKKTDEKRNKYTVEVWADDKRTEKKDKGINEPVQFYTSKARIPYEIVINEVKKDQIVGYLATPKVTVAR
jgi:multidrug efflux pump subunit AcrA (membrane-fusion protein)